MLVRRLEPTRSADAPIGPEVRNVVQETTRQGAVRATVEPGLAPRQTPVRRATTEVPTTPAGLGAFFGRIGRPAVKAVLVGAMGLGFLMGTPAQIATAAQTAPNPIVYVGMNEGASWEVQHLQQRVGAAGIHAITPSRQQDQVTHRSVRYDLTQAEARLAYARAIGLEGARAESLASILDRVGANGRDEVGKLALAFQQAETGSRHIERLVLSGHSVGSGVWGDDNGRITFAVVGELAELFPRAARQVEDLMLAACYTGGERTMDQFRAIFPNLKTAWAYTGSAPGAASGAVPHMFRWETATRGRNTEMSRTLANNTRKGENVATWTVTRGYESSRPERALESTRSVYEQSAPTVAAFLSGERVVTSTQSGPLRDHYNNLQALLQHRDLPTADRPALEAERDQVIRLIYWGNVSRFFDQHHTRDIRAGFAELGLAVPSFQGMSRADALAVIARFDEAHGRLERPSPMLERLREVLHGGLRELSPEFVPPSWI